MWVAAAASCLLPACLSLRAPTSAASSAPVPCLNDSPSTQAMAAPAPDVPPPRREEQCALSTPFSTGAVKTPSPSEGFLWDGKVLSAQSPRPVFTQPVYTVHSLAVDGVLPSADVRGPSGRRSWPVRWGSRGASGSGPLRERPAGLAHRRDSGWESVTTRHSRQTSPPVWGRELWTHWARLRGAGWLSGRTYLCSLSRNHHHDDAV